MRGKQEPDKQSIRSAGVNSKLAAPSKAQIRESPSVKGLDSATKSSSKANNLESAIQQQVALRKLHNQDGASVNNLRSGRKQQLAQDFLDDLKLPNVEESQPSLNLNMAKNASKASLIESGLKRSDFDNRPPLGRQSQH